MKSFLLSACLVVTSVLPASAQQAPWLASYEYTDGVFEIAIELEQLPGGTVGDASIFMFTEPTWCQQDARLEFCQDIARGLKADPSGYGYTVRGVVYREDRATIAFSFPGDNVVRVAQITRQGSNFDLLIAHPQRGVDIEIPLSRGPHSCNSAMCTGDRLDHLRGNPASFAGPLADAAFLRSFPAIMLAQGNSGVQPQPAPAPVPPSANQATTWGIIDQADGRRRGLLHLDTWGNTISGSGVMDSVGFGPDTEVSIVPDRIRGEGYSLRVTYYASGSGEQRDGLLLLGGAIADGVLEGTLIEDTYVEVVRLVRDNNASYGPADSGPDPEDLYDLPGIGVYGPSYELRNVPEGQRLAVRSAPQRTTGALGSLSRTVSGILVVGCTPDIDSWTFEQADMAGKRALLDGVWCEIQHDGITGWVAGTYLEPAFLPERL